MIWFKFIRLYSIVRPFQSHKHTLIFVQVLFTYVDFNPSGNIFCKWWVEGSVWTFFFPDGKSVAQYHLVTTLFSC